MNHVNSPPAGLINLKIDTAYVSLPFLEKFSADSESGEKYVETFQKLIQEHNSSAE